MTIRWLLAALHLLALGIGLGAVWARGRALRDALDASGLRRAFHADAWWGIAAVLDRHRPGAGVRWIRKGQLLLSPQPRLLGEDGLPRRDPHPRASPDDGTDSVAPPGRSRRGSRHASRERVRADQFHTDRTRRAHGVGCHRHGPWLRGAGAVKGPRPGQRRCPLTGAPK